MDTSQYLPMFLAEGREHLQELNLAVVRIEEQPDDRETVDEIFRIAHSLKGMSATMGFAGMAALTHEMEDVFELLRQRTRRPGARAIDVLLECLDALEARRRRDRGRRRRATSSPRRSIERLQGARPRPHARPGRRTPRRRGRRRRRRPSPSAAARPTRCVHASRHARRRRSMPAVRAYMVLAAARRARRASSPPPRRRTHVEAFDGRRVDVWVAAEVEAAALSAAADAPCPTSPTARGRRASPRPASTPARPSPPRRAAAAPSRPAERAARPGAPPRPCASTPSGSTS